MQRNINIWILAHYETDMFYSHTSVHGKLGWGGWLRFVLFQGGNESVDVVVLLRWLCEAEENEAGSARSWVAVPTVFTRQTRGQTANTQLRKKVCIEILFKVWHYKLLRYNE